MSTTILASLVLSVPVFTSASQSRPATAERVIPGSPVLLFFGDVDGDKLEDAFSVGFTGEASLLHNEGNGRFEDITLAAGLAELSGVTFGVFADFDGDQTLDLYVGRTGDSPRVYRNHGNASFEPLPLGRGVHHPARDLSARAVDLDEDGALDLHVHTNMGDVVYRNTSHGFERMELGSPIAPTALWSGAIVEPTGSEHQPDSGSGPNRQTRGAAMRSGSGGLRGTEAFGWGRFGSPSGDSGEGSDPVVEMLGQVPIGCLRTLRDQNFSNPGCIPASIDPGVVGRLYPLSLNLFVATSGNVGIGTLTPAARLEVAGTARVTDTLTLNPSPSTGDQSLDVSTGSIYKGGALFIHTRGAAANTGLGLGALAIVSSGSGNTGLGMNALGSNDAGEKNTAIGNGALSTNTSGSFNAAVGVDALRSNTIGVLNTAIGLSALHTNTSGSRNSATGVFALFKNTLGNHNTACGYGALYSNENGSDNTASGMDALRLNTSGVGNTASGKNALRFNTRGSYNTASGLFALYRNTDGDHNAGFGEGALFSNVSGDYNTATGVQALFQTTTSNNTASGFRALFFNTTGTGNIALGRHAGYLTTGNDNIAIGNSGVPAESATIRIGTPGTHTGTYIAGIHGMMVSSATGIGVFVDAVGKLGTIVSSRRFKKDIRDMGDMTERLLKLRPVVFRYKQEQSVPNGEMPLEFGLIAEEVAEIFPDLVVYDDEGKPFTVKYHLLSSMLLNELKALDGRIEVQNDEHAREMEELRNRLAALESRAFPAPTAAGSR